MQRWLVVLVVVAVVVFGVWHPAGHAGSGFAQIPVPSSGADFSSRRRARGAPPASIGAEVYVVGAVVRPGLYRLGGRARVDDAVRAAGGLRPDADPAGVNLAALAADGDEIDVPRLGEVLPTRTRSRTTRARRTTRADAALPPVAAVDPNSADAQTLADVPGLSVALAQRIVTYREVNGPFGSLDELLDVAGMTPAKLDRAQPYLRLE